MRKRPNLFLTACLIFLLFLSSVYAENAFSQGQKNFLWKVGSKTGTVYLLGSIHFLKKELYPLSKTIEDSFEKSDVLAVEANVNDVGKIDIRKLTERAFYPGDETLERHVARETYERVKSKIDGYGMPPELFRKQRPWFLALTLTSFELVKMGFDPDYGVDRHFLLKASGKKKIVELESLDYQIDLLSGFSDREQELFLIHTLEDLVVLKEEMEPLVHAWRSGDTKGLESLLSKSSMADKSMSSFYEKLLYERNRNMASRIEEFLKSKETCFVVVGAGHLVGDKGIVEILRKKGYSVKQL